MTLWTWLAVIEAPFALIGLWFALFVLRNIKTIKILRDM